MARGGGGREKFGVDDGAAEAAALAGVEAEPREARR
jgi:hypothetical protein